MLANFLIPATENWFGHDEIIFQEVIEQRELKLFFWKGIKNDGMASKHCGFKSIREFMKENFKNHLWEVSIHLRSINSH